MSDIDFLVDRLEELVINGTRIPMTTKLLLDEEDLLRIIDQMRTSIPGEVREAQRILQEREAILDQGREKADHIVRLAQQQSDQMVSESSVLSRAEQERQAILEAALAEADRLRQASEAEVARLRAEADAYALDVLRELDRNLITFQRTVANGIALLKQSQAERKSGEK